MRKALIAALLLFSLPLFGQGVAVSLRNGSADPAQCQPSSLNVFYNTTSTTLKTCTASNTWTALGLFTGGTVTSAILAANGSGTAPSYSFTNFTNEGMYAEAGFLNLTSGENVFRVMAQTAPPGALTTALVLIAGNVNNGSHSYKVTFVTATGETEGGTISNAVTNDGTHGQNTLTAVPLSPFPGVTSRKVYRNKIADQTHWFLQQTIANNTATTGVQDNTADAGLGAAMPTTNTTLDARLTVGNNGTVQQSFWPQKFVSGAGAGNAADLTDDVLWNLAAVPASTLTANGDELILTLTFQTGATANAKRLGVNVAGVCTTTCAGGTQLNISSIANNNNTFIFVATITRVDATHVNVAIAGTAGTGNALSANLVVSDLTANALAIAVTGASPTTGAANDVKLYAGVGDLKK